MPRAPGRWVLRWSGKALRDGHPAFGNRTDDLQLRIANVAALRDHLAEFGCASGDEIIAIAVIPNRSRWRSQAETRHRAGLFFFAVLERPAKGVHAQANDIADAVIVEALHPQHIVNRLRNNLDVIAKSAREGGVWTTTHPITSAIS